MSRWVARQNIEDETGRGAKERKGRSRMTKGGLQVDDEKKNKGASGKRVERGMGKVVFVVLSAHF